MYLLTFPFDIFDLSQINSMSAKNVEQLISASAEFEAIVYMLYLTLPCCDKRWFLDL